ncbi:MAG: glycosyltransferase family 2 protein, partial [Terracidiphilus sp.]
NLTAIQIVNLLLLRRILPTKSVAVVATMRDEGPSLLEWIAFNRAIGLADIFVYSNDNADGSDELLEVLALAGVIKLIKSAIGPGTNPQRKAYQHAVHLLRELRTYRWVFFLDADEFLTPDERYDYRLDSLIARVEGTFQESLPGAVVFPWEWRFNSLKFEKTDGLLFERYPHSTSHFQVKSMTHLSAAFGMCEVHIPTLEKGSILVDSALSPVDADFTWSRNPKSPAGGTISHFWGKSFEEFAVKKRRGELLSLGNDSFSRKFKEYFEWTTNPTPENFHPAPQILLQRLQSSLGQLRAIPGVNPASDRIEAMYNELCRKIEAENNLRGLFNQLRLSFQPMAKQ